MILETHHGTILLKLWYGYLKKDDRSMTGPRMDTIYNRSFETAIYEPY